MPSSNINVLEQGSKQALTPDSFNCKEILIRNYKGVEKDIRNLVVKFTISESLYMNSIVAKFDINDSANFFEEFPITGQETIQLKLERKSVFTTGEPNEIIDLFLFVTEYPLYGRSGQHRHVYSLSAISPHAYTSSFRKISRSYDGLLSDEIRNIIVNDLKLPKDNFKLTGAPISRSKGIINIQAPLNAANWFLSKTFDEQLAPFFLFQTLWGNVQLSSLSSFIEQKPYGEYVYTKGFAKNAQTSEDYLERAKRIMELASDLNIGKMFQGKEGAFGSKNNYLDYTSKTYTNYIYEYGKDLLSKSNSLEDGTVLSKSFRSSTEEIDTLSEAHCEYTSINSGAYGPDNNFNALRKDTKGVTKAYHEVLDTKSHEIVLCGDMGLNPGRVIDLKFQRAIDPQSMKKMIDKNPRDLWDEHLSGRYLIVSTIHTFNESKYYTSVKVKRDSFSIDISK